MRPDRLAPKARKETKVKQAIRGLLVPPGPQARSALLGQLAAMGPRALRETGARQANRVRLETLVQLVPRVTPVQRVRPDRKAR